MPFAVLKDRSVLSVSGPDAEHFLQNILTVDLGKLSQGEAKPGALLSPQGKILFDFMISRNGADRFRLDCRAAVAGDFLRRLMLYRLRAKVELSIEEQVVVGVSWEDDSGPSQTDSTRVADTRFKEVPVFRTYGASFPPPLTPPHKGEGNVGDSAPESPSPGGGGGRGGGTADWERLRIAHGIAESGSDYALGDAFPHDVLLDQTGGVGFQKGCYVGQEVVSRMQHRGTARRRVLLVSAEAPLPAPGTEIIAGGKALGALGSVAGNHGLAIVRIDRVKDALDAGQEITAADVAIKLAIPGWATFSFPQQAEG